MFKEGNTETPDQTGVSFQDLREGGQNLGSCRFMTKEEIQAMKAAKQRFRPIYMKLAERLGRDDPANTH